MGKAAVLLLKFLGLMTGSASSAVWSEHPYLSMEGGTHAADATTASRIGATSTPKLSSQYKSDNKGGNGKGGKAAGGKGDKGKGGKGGEGGQSSKESVTANKSP